MKIFLCSSDRPEFACGSIRIAAPLGRYKEFQIRWYSRQTFLNDLEWADLIVLQRAFPAAQRMKHLQAIIRSNKPIIYETDDIFREIQRDHPNWSEIKSVADTIDWIIPKCQAVITSTKWLADILHPPVPTFILPNLLDETIWPIRTPVQNTGPISIVFAGTPSRQTDLAICETALLKILDKYGDSVRLLLFGCSTPLLESANGVIIHPFNSDYHYYSQQLLKSGGQIGIAPLRDTPFNRAKSEIKWLELTACGMAGVFSDLPPYQGVVEDQMNGLLVPQNSEAWYDALDRLIKNPILRENLARQSQNKLIDAHTLAVGASAYAAKYKEIAQNSSSSRGNTLLRTMLIRLRYWLGI